MISLKRSLTAGMLSILLVTFAGPASAVWHEEGRGFDDGKLYISVGWYADPPYLNEPATLYVIPYANAKLDSEGGFIDGRPIIVSDNKPGHPETYPWDKVQLRAKIQLLESPDPSAKVVKESWIPGQFKELWEGYNVYGVELIPGKAGAVAVVLKGSINGTSLDGERFVCKPPEQLHILQSDGMSCVAERSNKLGTAPVRVPHRLPAP